MFDEIEYLPSIYPASFFDVSIAAHFGSKFDFKKDGDKYVVPNFSELIDENNDHVFSLQYSKNTLRFHFLIKSPFEGVSVKNYEKEDSIELFIVSQNTEIETVHPFVHHFVFFPQPVAEVAGMEITKFKGGAIRDLAPSKSLSCATNFGANTYESLIELGADAIHGLSLKPETTLRICYKINRTKNDPIHWFRSSKNMKIADYPFLWPRVVLQKK